jgi:hypothetical protein
VEFVFFVLAFIVASGVAIVQLAAGTRRRAALRDFAERFSLDYSPVDAFGLIDHSFDVFNRADGARCENVLWGDWHGVEVMVGELRFEASAQRSRRDLLETRRRYSFAVVEIDARLPHLVIRHDPLAGLTESLLLDRLRFESDVFNRTYRVDCADQRFAYKLVDARMMLWLEEIAESFRFDSR